MRRLYHLLFGLLLLSPVGAAAAQDPASPPSEIPNEVIESIRQRVDLGRNVGIVIGIVGPGTEDYFSYGVTAAGGTKEPDRHTVFEIGSITKVFTGLLLADMVERGEVQLSDPVSRYLPETVHVPEWDGNQITLEDLSTHMSGLPRLPSNLSPEDASNPYADYTEDQLYAFLSGYQLTRPIGAEYEYSNLAAGLLGHVLALRRGTTYEELLEKRILDVLDMNETAITLTPGMQDRLARGHAGGSPVPNWDLPTLAGAGAIRSTAYDMLRFLAANMNLGDAPPSLRVEENPLHDAMLETQRIHADHVSNGMSVGLGWHIRDGDATETVWHNGGTGGYRSFTGFNRSGTLGVVVLTNSNESVDDLGFHVLDPSLPLTEVEPQDFPEEVDVSVDVMQTYVGTYQITPNFTVDVTLEGSQLYAQATGQPRFPVFASAQNEFFWKVVQASMTFNRDAEGNVVSILLHQNGADVPGLRAN